MVTVGLDLHKRYITACALDDAGTVLAEHRRLEPSLDALGRWLGALPQPLTVALEATLYWHWLERQFTELGMHLLVAHPYQVKLIWQASYEALFCQGVIVRRPRLRSRATAARRRATADGAPGAGQ